MYFTVVIITCITLTGEYGNESFTLI